MENNSAYMIGIVTTIILVLRIGELFIDPFIGNTIDKTKTRWGERSHGLSLVQSSRRSRFPSCSRIWAALTSSPVIYLIVFSILYPLIMDVFIHQDVAIWSMIPAFL